MNWQIIVDIANLIVAVGVIFAITQINISRKQLHLSTLNRCIDVFRKMSDVRSAQSSATDVYNYIDFVNEELFYMQHKYLPKVVALEWLDGMIDYIPLTNKNNEILNFGNCIHQLEANGDVFFQDFPRLKKTFCLKKSYDFSIVYNRELDKQVKRIITRKAIAEEIYKNVMNFKF